ncbi:MAG: AAA-like domain-containing protein [Cyanobacteria bacterium J06621_11]
MLSRAEFEEAFEALTPKRKAVLKLFLSGLNDKRITNLCKFKNRASVTHHLSNAAQTFGFVRIPDRRNFYRDDLIELFYKHKPDWVDDSLIDPIERQPPSPKAVMSAESRFYIRQEKIENDANKLIRDEQAGRLIRFFSPRHSGKTLLCKRLLTYVKSKLNYRAVVVDFNELSPAKLSSLEEVWAHFFRHMHRQLGLSAEQTWSICQSPDFDQTDYLAELVLEPSTIPIVVVMENVDKLFGDEVVARDFFSRVRYWSENRSGEADLIWQRLRQVMIYSTDIYIDFPLTQSPFNRGIELKLPMFGAEQILIMAQRYGEPLSMWGEVEAAQLLAFSGGIPYLVHLALHHIYQADGEVLLTDIINKTSVMQMVYEEHLNELLVNLNKYPTLLSAFSELVKSPLTKLDPMAGIHLKGAGIVRQRPTDTRLVVSCQLYQSYFESVL